VGRPLSDEEWARFETVSDLVQERTRLLPDAGAQVVFLFEDFEDYDEASWEKVMTREGVAAIVDRARVLLGAVEDWTAEVIESVLRVMLEEMGIGTGKGLQPLRVAVTGSSVSPPLFESMAALGKKKTLHRLDRASARLAT
jgi:glutamyl-tRNA synthetase